MIYSFSQQMGVNVDDDMFLTSTEQIIPINTVNWGNTAGGSAWVVDEQGNDYYFNMTEQEGAPTCYRVIANLPFVVYDHITGEPLWQNNFLKVRMELDTRQGVKTREAFWQSSVSEYQEVKMGLDNSVSRNIMMDEVFDVVLPAQIRFFVSKYNDDGGAMLLGGKTNCFIYSLSHEGVS